MLDSTRVTLPLMLKGNVLEEDHAGQHALQHACVHTLTRRIQDKVVHGDWRYPVVESLQENHAGVNRINKCPFD